MLDPARLAAFTLVTATASLVPGPQMVFVLTQAAWRGPRAGLGALLGLQLGNLSWFVLAGLGLGTLAAAAPHAFTLLAVVGALYLAWLGLQAIRHAGRGAHEGAAPPPRASARGLRDSLAIALSNPKSLVYVLALLPPSSIRAPRLRRSWRCWRQSPSAATSPLARPMSRRAAGSRRCCSARSCASG